MSAPEERVRDVYPEAALGRRGGPASWRRAVEGAAVDGFAGRFRDGALSFLFRGETRYAREPEEVGEVNREMRGRSGEIQGPMMNPPVWTWEVPVYFWLGGIATGSAFIAFACDLAEDERSARLARWVAVLGAGAGGPLLIADLGRPGRFHKMFRVFKPRSPMSMGAWLFGAFSVLSGGAAGAQLLGRVRPARAAGAGAAVAGIYAGSYTGALLSSTAVPVWARSRPLLSPLFVCSAVATAAAVNRLALAASGTPAGHPTRTALGALETGATVAELALSAVNERRLGPLAVVPRELALSKWAARLGLALRLGPAWAHHLGSVLFLAGGLLFRFGWISAGKASARDDEAVVRMAR